MDTADTVTLAVSGTSATAATTPITVTDTRNTFPGWSGLGTTPGVLASATSGLGNGFGTTTLGANLTLDFPASQAAGPYSGGPNITSVSTSP